MIDILLFVLIYTAWTIHVFKSKTTYQSLSLKELKRRLNENRFLLGFAILVFFVGIYLNYQEYLSLETFNPLEFLNFYTPLLFISLGNIFIIKKYIKQQQQAES